MMPRKMVWMRGSIFSRSMALVRISRNTEASATISTRPTPPLRLTPAITAAAILSSVSCEEITAWPEPICAVSARPETEASSEQIT